MKKKITIIIFLIIFLIQALQIIEPMKINSYSKTEKTEQVKAQTQTQMSHSIFDESVTFSWSYNSNAEGMPYGLFTPSNADELDSVPLIVWIHGAGEIGQGEGALKIAGLPGAISNWKSTGFSAYILCPQLQYGNWVNTTAFNNVKTVIDNFISEYNVDTENVVIVGHSSGGMGALYLAYHIPEYFKRGVALSPYYPGIDPTKITIPMLAYSGTYGDDDSQTFINAYMKPTFGAENCLRVSSNHGGVPAAAFNDDSGEKISRSNRRR